ncbi:uncharacterized protein TNCV_647991 [Trichonephila clavipes]|uniref:Uncharacterized protein n=1 Tax=Trichonephila clavipes TaxID=2585209 RepID=A0A8X6SJX2_TRICX|nr:uncharacterized protein TNCV_647991 [Trichonephila clavipes]
MNSDVLIGLSFSNRSLAIAASLAPKGRTLWQNMAATSHGLLGPCRAASLFQLSPDPWENRFAELENDAKGKIWDTLLHNPVPINIPRQIFSANFRTLTGHYFQGYLHRIGGKTPLTVSKKEVMNFNYLTVCASLTNTNFNFELSSSNIFSEKASLYWSARREIAYKASSSA